MIDLESILLDCFGLSYVEKRSLMAARLGDVSTRIFGG